MRNILESPLPSFGIEVKLLNTFPASLLCHYWQQQVFPHNQTKISLWFFWKLYHSHDSSKKQSPTYLCKKSFQLARLWSVPLPLKLEQNWAKFSIFSSHAREKIRTFRKSENSRMRNKKKLSRSKKDQSSCRGKDKDLEENVSCYWDISLIQNDWRCKVSVTD